MTARKPELTARERQLLAAVVQLLDLPPAADYDGLQTRADTLECRVNLMIGALRCIDNPVARADAVLATLGKFAAGPLGYTPKGAEPQPIEDRFAHLLGNPS